MNRAHVLDPPPTFCGGTTCAHPPVCAFSHAGVLFKRIPKFGILLGYGVVTGDKSGKPGFAAATAASILSAPFINPVRMVEKQQRAFLKQTGAEKPLMEIMRESAAKNFVPLFRGTVPLMGHSLASAILGLVGQPRLQKYVQKELGATGYLGQSGTNLVASAVVSPIYVVVTNPLSRLEVIMQARACARACACAFVRACVSPGARHGACGAVRTHAHAQHVFACVPRAKAPSRRMPPTHPPTPTPDAPCRCRAAADVVDAEQGHHHDGGVQRDVRRHAPVRPVRRLPRPGHRHRQGHRLAHALPRGPHVPRATVQGAQQDQRLDARHVQGEVDRGGGHALQVERCTEHSK